ncbi:Sensor histidine kinase RcsC [subsurface metagenome]
MRDITIRTQSEQKLKESEEKYRSLFNNMNAGFAYHEVIVDKNNKPIDYKYIEVNPAFETLTGLKADQMIGKKVTEILPGTENDPADWIGKFGNVGLTGIPFTVEDYSEALDHWYKVSGYSPKKGYFAVTFSDITEQKKAEIKIAESEEKYRSLFNNAPFAIVLFNIEGIILDCNDASNLITGYSKEELIGKNFRDFNFYVDINSANIEEREEKIKDGKIPKTRDVLLHKKDGSQFWARTNIEFVHMRDETYIQAIIQDVSEQKQSQIKLKESEEKYRNMINNLDLGFFQVNWGGDLLNHNPAFNYLLGFEPTEDLSKINVKQFWQNPSERDIYLKKLKEESFVKNYIVQSQKKNGQNIVLQLNSHLIDSQPIKIQGLISDITEKFELEQKVKESESRYRNLFESVPFAISLIDQKGKIIYCNPPTEKLLGYNIEELIGNEFRNLVAIHPDYLPMMLKRFQKLIKGENLPPFDAEFYKKNGDLVWINYQTSLVKLGETLLIQVILHDITDRKRADLLVQEEIQKLKELDQIRKDLISRVSHELKTPLVSVCGASELLLELFKDEINEECKELIKMIEKGGSRLKYLVDNLLDITRIEYDKFELITDLTNLSDIIQDCANEMMYLIKKRKLDLKLELPNELIINLDKVRIEQVVLNLLSNAIKNTPPNGKILIKLYRKGKWAKFFVNDTGIGLTREEMDRIFTRFGKIERYAEGLEFIDIQGSGLGLYISKEIIDLHKGQICAESAGRDKGSTFIIKLPFS